MRIHLNTYQRVALFVVAICIVAIQFTAFDDVGFEGYGWIFSFLIAGVLVVVALSNRPESPSALRESGSHPLVPSKEQIEASHRELRANAEALYYEVEKRAEDLSASLIAQRRKDTEGLVMTIQGSPDLGVALGQHIENHLKERCYGLMLAAVGMRRSKGNKLYVTGLEFRTLQDRVSEKCMKLSVESMRRLPTSDVDTAALTKKMMEELQEIRKSVVEYCIRSEVGGPHPEQSILNWFTASTWPGVSLGNHVRNALSERSHG